ncbi:MAG: hypothetical protein KAU02_02315 [Tenericutes bacterium]|nr:hypothetical protein [Mycoplasmatota bacterium]
MYYLIGKKLSHSFSKQIHHLFGNTKYDLCEVNSLSDFVKNHNYKGFNITNPYKTEVISLLDELDPIAKETQSVNTVIRRDNKLIGYNTDYYGLKETLNYNQVNIKGKDVLILGNGSVSKTVFKLLTDLKANSIVKLCRTIRGQNEYLFKDYKNYTDYDILINTTTVGMYPNNDTCSLLSLTDFSKLDVVIDLIYNPLRTALLIEAEKLNIKIINGLQMLVMQAKKAHEIFHNIEIPKNLANKIYKKTFNNYVNLVFVGLPLSGKTKYAKTIGKYLSKTVIDVDQCIEKTEGKSVSDIFLDKGEAAFRLMEHDSVIKIYKDHVLAVSTGGGLIENDKAMDLLKQNGLVVFLNKNPKDIARKNIYNRPLLIDPNAIFAIAKRRVPLYIKYSDFVININGSTEYHINEIKEKVDEYTNR